MFIAFSLQQWLHERASTLRFTYIACLVIMLRLVQGTYLNWGVNCAMRSDRKLMNCE